MSSASRKITVEDDSLIDSVFDSWWLLLIFAHQQCSLPRLSSSRVIGQSKKWFAEHKTTKKNNTAERGSCLQVFTFLCNSLSLCFISTFLVNFCPVLDSYQLLFLWWWKTVFSLAFNSLSDWILIATARAHNSSTHRVHRAVRAVKLNMRNEGQTRSAASDTE